MLLFKVSDENTNQQIARSVTIVITNNRNLRPIWSGRGSVDVMPGYSRSGGGCVMDGRIVVLKKESSFSRRHDDGDAVDAADVERGRGSDCVGDGDAAAGIDDAGSWIRNDASLSGQRQPTGQDGADTADAMRACRPESGVHKGNRRERTTRKHM